MMDRNAANNEPDFEAFRALADGRVSRGLERLQLAGSARLFAGRLAVILAAATWLPLFVLAAIEGVAWGSAVQVPVRRMKSPWM